MKRLLLLLTILFSLPGNATHIVGGELIYQHLGGSSYYLTVKLYKDCRDTVPAVLNFPSSIEVEAFSGFGLDTIGTKADEDYFSLPRLGRDTLSPSIDTCAFNPGVCVEEAIYGAIVNLPPVAGGYHLFYQTYARNSTLLNVVDPTDAGETFYAYVPDNSLFLTNSSPVFSNSPPVFVCLGNDLNLDFSATDVDGDSLVYSFYQPYTGRSFAHPFHFDPAQFYPTITLADSPPDNISFPEIVYAPGFSADNPLNAISGTPLTINSAGIINGVPEAQGQYVVGVMVEEYRDGIKIGEIIRDFQFNVLVCPPPQDAGIGDIEGCSGSVITFENSSGLGAEDFWWDFGTGNPADTSILAEPTFDFTALAPGTFTITLIAQNGTPCADTTYKELILSGVDAIFSTPDTVCTQEPINPINTSTSQINGVIDQWEWDFGDGATSDLENPLHFFTMPGDYTIQLIVTSDIGCSDTLEKSIRVNDPPGAGIMPLFGCIGLDVDFTNTSSADAENFLWDFGTGFPADTSNEFNPSFTYANYGVYTVTLITEPGTFCADTATLDLMISNATADFAIPDTTCANVLIEFMDLSTTNNGSIFSWEWAFGDASTSTTPSPSYGYTIPGNYTVSLNILSDIGCTDTITKEITIFEAPLARIGPLDACSGLTIDFLNDSDEGAQDFWWNFGTGSTSDTSIVSEPTFTYDSYGTYTVTFVAQRGSICETTTELDFVLSELSGAVSMPDTICINTEINFLDLSSTADGAVIDEWDWNFGDIETSDLQNPNHTYTDDGDFNVTFIVHSDIGCIDTLNRNLFVQPIPTAFAGLDTNVCLESPSLELPGEITGSTSGIWTGDGGVFSPANTDLNATYFPSLDELVAGSSNLVLTTVGNGYCSEQIDSLRITYLGDPNINAGLDIEVCEGTTEVDLSAVTDFDAGIIWTTEGDGIFTNDDNLITGYEFGTNDILLGSITIHVNTFNLSGCLEDADTLQININPPPTFATMSDTVICSGEPLLLISNTSTGDGIWETTGDGIFDPSTGENSVYIHGPDDLTSGIFNIYFQSTNNGGCEAVYDTLNVDVTKGPQADFTASESCFGTETEFTNTTTSDEIIDSYTWTFEAGETSTLENPSYVFSGPGTYPVELIVLSVNGCGDTIQKDVETYHVPVANFLSPIACLNGGTNFIDYSSIEVGSIVGWSWEFGDGTGTDTVQNPNYQYPIQDTYEITLTATSSLGCSHDTTISQYISQGPSAGFSMDPASTNLFVDINYTDESVANESPISSWLWDFGDEVTATEQNVIHQYNLEGEYNVQLVVTDITGCSDTANLVIPIYHGPLVPSAFSPNGDLNNDNLMILGGNFTAIDFMVYNNWGEIIFETKDINSIGWDGTFKGEPQPLGVYVYVARVTTFDGVDHVISGDVSLIR